MAAFRLAAALAVAVPAAALMKANERGHHSGDLSLGLGLVADSIKESMEDSIKDGMKPMKNGIKKITVQERLSAVAELLGYSTQTLSPEQRKQAHAYQFEKEFTIELDMAKAHDTGMNVGINLDVDTDFTPVSVLAIQKTGLMEAWNKEHPDRALLVGDQIHKVNDILWHHNSQKFVERIKGQFHASRKQMAGAKEILQLTVMRPRKESHQRYALQREDRHNQLYSTEFTAEIPYVGVMPKERLDQAMGWKLNTSVGWMPASIEKLRDTGMIAAFNKLNPELKIKSGDEILQVNHVAWHHNTSVFEDRLNAQYVAGRTAEFTKPKGAKNVLSLRIRRPRSAKDIPEDQVYTKQYLVQLDLKDAHPLGWKLNFTDEGSPIVVDKIRPDGPIFDFNKANPKNAVQVGDSIVRVNDVLWHGNTFKLAQRIQKEFEKARPRKGSVPENSTLQLLMQRRVVMPIEREWSVTMPAEEGKTLGWALNVTDDEFPVTVSRVRTTGAVFLNNQKHPESLVRSGDIIVKVNDFLWNRNSYAFEKRLNELYSKSKLRGNITFFMRRPAGIQEEVSPFYKEYIVELPMVRGQPTGWQLNATNDTSPLFIAKVRTTGALNDWNTQNPLDEVIVGDQIARVNNIPFRGNSTVFMERLNAQMESARSGKAGTTLQLLLQRPWHTAKNDDDGLNKNADDNEGFVGAED